MTWIVQPGLAASIIKPMIEVPPTRTPSNLAISVMESGRVEVIAGVNLPMLIKLTSARKGDDMPKALELAQGAGRKYINVASQVLSGK